MEEELMYVQIYPATSAFPNGSYHSGVDRPHLNELTKQGWRPVPGSFCGPTSQPNTFERHGSDYQFHPVQALFTRSIHRRYGPPEKEGQ
jgi:hypothetical protein